jgi:hypothetical protein
MNTGENCDNSVGVATPTFWTAVVRFLVEETGFGTHPISYLMDTEGSLPAVESEGGVKLTTHLQLVPVSRIVEQYLHSPKCHVVMLN